MAIELKKKVIFKQILFLKSLLLLLICPVIFSSCSNSGIENKVSTGIILEITPTGKIVWQSTKYKLPVVFSEDQEGNKIIADKNDGLSVVLNKRLSENFIYFNNNTEFFEKTPDGNYLLVNENINPSIIELNPLGEVIWEINNHIHLGEAHKLKDGNYLLISREDHTAKIINKNGKILWQSAKDLLRQPYSIQQLENDNFLITDFDNNRIVEIDKNSTIKWQSKVELKHPIASRKLNNGSYVIADRDNNRVIILNKNQQIIKEINNIYPRNVMLFPDGNIGIAGYTIE